MRAITRMAGPLFCRRAGGRHRPASRAALAARIQPAQRHQLGMGGVDAPTDYGGVWQGAIKGFHTLNFPVEMYGSLTTNLRNGSGMESR